MPLALKVVSELDERAAKSAADEAVRTFSDAGRRAGHELLSGLTSGLSSGIPQVGRVAEEMAGTVSKGALLAGAGILGIGAAAVTVGKQLYDLGAVWDTISDNITVRTGAMGADLAKLTDAVGDIGRVTAASLGAIGDVVSQLRQSMPDLAANNDALREMGSNLAFLGEHGQAVNIRELGMALTAFGVNAADAVGALDSLNSVSQKTGIPINSLIESVRSGAPQFKQFGLDISQATGLLTAFSEAGIEPGLAVSGLRIGLKNLGDDARGAGPALADVITKIKAFHDANDEISARKLAEDTFGARNFAPFLDAIETGTVNVKALTSAVNETGDSIKDLQKGTDDGAQGFTKMKNAAASALKPIGDFLFSNVNQPLLQIMDNIDNLEHKATAPITPDSPLGRMLLPAGGLPGSPGQPSPNGVGGAATDGRLLPYSWGTTPINPPAAPGAGKTPALGQAEVPYGPGYGAPPRPGETTSVYNAEQGILEAQHKTAESRAQLARVEADSKHTADELIKARNDLAKAEGDEIQAQMRLSDAYAEASKKAEKAGTTLDEFGNKLDADLGLSEGLPGLADNLFRFLGNLAAAPILGQLGAISQAQGGIDKTGSGLIGMITSQMPQFQQPPGSSDVYAPSGAASGPGVSANFANLPDVRGAHQQIAEIAAIARDQFGLSVSAGRDDHDKDGGYHPLGEAGDFTGSPEQMAAFSNYMAQNFGPDIAELIHEGGDTRTNIKNGRDTPVIDQPGSIYSTAQAGNHDDHVHIAMTDDMFPAFQQALGGGEIPGPVSNLSSFGEPGSPKAVANMIYQQAVSRGYSQHEATSIVAYAVGESGLRPGVSGGVQGGAEVVGLFQEQPGFAAAGGISPAQRSDPVANTTAYLNQLEAHRNLPIEQALPATSKGGPLASGPGSAPQAWGPLMTQAQNYLQPPSAASGGGIPIIAHAGEHVLTAGDVAAMGGQVGVYNFRNALHMAGGGPPESPQLPPPPPPPPVQHMPTSSGRGSGPAPGPQPMAGTGLGSTTLGPGSSVASGQGGGPAPGPSPIGGKEQPAPPGGSAAAGGGAWGAATGAAAMAADLFAPGSGAAVQVASQVIQRAVKFGGQLAGIGVGGLMQTFLPTGASDLANNNWATRIAGGFAGVQPQIPNLAGKSASVDAMQQKALSPSALPPPISSGQGSGAPPGPTQNLTINNYGATPDQTASAATHHLNIMNNGIQGSR